MMRLPSNKKLTGVKTKEKLHIFRCFYNFFFSKLSWMSPSRNHKLVFHYGLIPKSWMSYFKAGIINFHRLPVGINTGMHSITGVDTDNLCYNLKTYSNFYYMRSLFWKRVFLVQNRKIEHQKIVHTFWGQIFSRLKIAKIARFYGLTFANDLL